MSLFLTILLHKKPTAISQKALTVLQNFAENTVYKKSHMVLRSRMFIATSPWLRRTTYGFKNHSIMSSFLKQFILQIPKRKCFKKPRKVCRPVSKPVTRTYRQNVCQKCHKRPPTKKYIKLPVRECHQEEPKEICTPKYAEECTDVPEKVCKTRYEEKCIDEPKEICKPTTTKECRQEPMQVRFKLKWSDFVWQSFFKIGNSKKKIRHNNTF